MQYVAFARKIQTFTKVFFLFRTNLHFLADIATILWAKNCEIVCYLTLVQYGAFALKIQKTGAKTFITKVHTPANEFQTHQNF